MARPIESWVEIFNDIRNHSTLNRTVEEALADRIFSDLVGYRTTAYRAADAEELANALLAYGRLLDAVEHESYGRTYRDEP